MIRRRDKIDILMDNLIRADQLLGGAKTEMLREKRIGQVKTARTAIREYIGYRILKVLNV